MMGNPIPDPIGPIGHGFEEGHPWYLQIEHMVDKKLVGKYVDAKTRGFQMAIPISHSISKLGTKSKSAHPHFSL